MTIALCRCYAHLRLLVSDEVKKQEEFHETFACCGLTRFSSCPYNPDLELDESNQHALLHLVWLLSSMPVIGNNCDITFFPSHYQKKN